jgi:alkylation response protein AidB-like acyl-CoA dehydrogenase
MRSGFEAEGQTVNLTLSTEQTQLKDSVARFAAAHGVHGALVGEDARATDFRPELWRQMAELGWLGAGLSEEEGGFGGGPVETMVVLEEAGRGLLPEPLLEAAIAARILAATRPAGDLLAGIVGGEELVVPAFGDARAGGAATAHLAGDGAGLTLSGVARLVPAAAHAGRFIVSCAAGDGAALVVVAADAVGGEIEAFRTMDGRGAATVSFNGVAVAQKDVLARGEDARAALDIGRDVALAALCAEVTGIAAFLFEQTLDYLKTRRQFGQPIGRFQALQHRMADMFVALEEARSLTVMAAVKLASGDPAERAYALSAARIGAVSRALHVAREAIQLHGGVGMTQELPIGAGFKRIKALELMFGGENHHLDRMTASEPAAV